MRPVSEMLQVALITVSLGCLAGRWTSAVKRFGQVRLGRLKYNVMGYLRSLPSHFLEYILSLCPRATCWWCT
jgi:hypothetical protein